MNIPSSQVHYGLSRQLSKTNDLSTTQLQSCDDIIMLLGEANTVASGRDPGDDDDAAAVGMTGCALENLDLLPLVSLDHLKSLSTDRCQQAPQE
jgi:hypothetical protein